MKVLITARELIDHFGSALPLFRSNEMTPVFAPSERILDSRLINDIERFDGWIIGDEHVSRVLLTSAIRRGLKAAVKWGRGMENIDVAAARALAIFIRDIPAGEGEPIDAMTRRAISELLAKYQLKMILETNATRATHQRFCQFEI